MSAQIANSDRRKLNETESDNIAKSIVTTGAITPSPVGANRESCESVFATWFYAVPMLIGKALRRRLLRIRNSVKETRIVRVEYSPRLARKRVLSDEETPNMCQDDPASDPDQPAGGIEPAVDARLAQQPLDRALLIGPFHVTNSLASGERTNIPRAAEQRAPR